MSDELIEVWRKEHKDLLLKTNEWCLSNFHESNGKYLDWHLQASWEGFLMAKRSQPVIELPVPHGTQISFFELICRAIKDAGYQYKVKE